MFKYSTVFNIINGKNKPQMLTFMQGESINRKKAILIVNDINNKVLSNVNHFHILQFVQGNNRQPIGINFHYEDMKQFVIENLADPANDRREIANLFII
jgi:hypothetical protein